MHRNVLVWLVVLAVAGTSQAMVVVETFEGEVEGTALHDLPARAWGNWTTVVNSSRVIMRTAGEETDAPDGDPPDMDAQMHPSHGTNIAVMNLNEVNAYDAVQYSFQLHGTLGGPVWFQCTLNGPWDTQGNQARRMGVWWNEHELWYWHDPNTTKVADIPVPDGEPMWVHVRLNFNDEGSDGSQESVDVLYKIGDAAEWTLGLDDAPTPDNWDDVIGNLSIEAQRNNNEGLLHFDDVMLIPEPATLSLIGLGALALLRRRRA